MTRVKNPDKSWIERSKNSLAQGFPGTNSKRWSQYVQNVYPSHTNGFGSGPYLEDAWGNKYIDFICGLGAVSLGYSNQAVIDEVIRQARKGASHSFPTTLEVEVAEHLSGTIPQMQKVRFLKTGNEAAMASIRIARAVTGRSEILCRGYHGHGDVFVSLTEPALGVTDKFDIRLLTENEITTKTAAVIMEALELEFTDEWQTYIRGIRQKCRDVGALFIADEIVTGFRVPNWTVSQLWSLDPDLMLLGKGMANGFPLSAVGGRKEIMDHCEYFISSTFSGDAVSLAACRATLDELQKRDFKDLMFYGSRLQKKLNDLHPEIRFQGYGTRCMLNVTNPTTALFMQEMCKAGVLFGKAHFFNFSHLESNIEEMVTSTAESVVFRIKQGTVKLEGIAAMETFKR